MSKPSRRPTREARKAHQVKVKAARQRLNGADGVGYASELECRQDSCRKP